MQKVLLALSGTAIVFMSVKPASAVTLDIVTGGKEVAGQGLVSKVSGTTTFDFENGISTSGFVKFSSPTGSPAVVQGSKSGEYGAPFNDTSHYLTISSTRDNAVGNTGSVSVKFAQPLDYFGLYWGSIDDYNSIAFYKGDTLLNQYSGRDVPKTTASGNQTSLADNQYVNFFADTKGAFDTVVLSSTAPAFESDNFAYRQAPEPGSVLGLLTVGAVGAGFVLKRKCCFY
ncbi:MAG: PEP-CTERM sorting domain-containing protein [Rhizonema sp. PD37]|nr:PEP-CTERM sorting domain-containing protein [Rhizonema sp. PD37]